MREDEAVVPTDHPTPSPRLLEALAQRPGTVLRAVGAVALLGAGAGAVMGAGTVVIGVLRSVLTMGVRVQLADLASLMGLVGGFSALVSGLLAPIVFLGPLRRVPIGRAIARSMIGTLLGTLAGTLVGSPVRGMVSGYALTLATLWWLHRPHTSS
jgi:hypothetical protein